MELFSTRNMRIKITHHHRIAVQRNIVTIFVTMRRVV